MLRITGGTILKTKKIPKLQIHKYSTENQLPNQADVVVIGGGVAGCSLLYNLSKRGVKAVLLETAKITSGTTWHTSALCWRLRPCDVDIKLLESTRKLLIDLEQETGLNTGWINNGGLFIAKTEERIQEYKRLHTFGHFFNIESHIISPQEASKLSPMLDPNKFKGALYSPGDGFTDPSMYCAALIKGATTKGGQVIENCSVTNILTDQSTNVRKITGVETSKGTIKTSCVVNAGGVWSKNIADLVGLDLPVVPMKHSYIITESIPEVKNTPNIRDHDGSIYLRIQGDSVYLGGYENNPEIIRDMPSDFQFSLFELDKSLFEVHLKSAMDIAPVFGNIGIKSDVCGAEAFTPDHKPIMGEDPRLAGYFYSCGYNSLGINLSGGCAEQLGIWITKGRPEEPLFAYDIRRFTPNQRSDRAWVTETSQECYAKNYSIVFPHDQPLAGRNHKIGPFHEALVAGGAVMEQAQGWERPGYFVKDRTAPVRGYDWYGYYDHVDNPDKRYEQELEGDYTFGFSKHHDLIGEEANAARNNVALFDLSYFTKMYLTGPDAEKAADWIFTADTDKEPGRVVYTCSLNSRGGVEADVTVTALEEGVGTLVGPILKGKGYYIVAGGASGYQTVSHFKKELAKKNFKAVISDITDKLGVLSIQGPKSRELLQSITETPITDEKFPPGMSHLIKVNGHVCRAMRVSFIGELGYELHVPVASCVAVFNKVVDAGRGFDLRHAGFRALYSLSLEKGYHLWNHDLRIDDNPVEANLQGICRKDGQYLGKQHVEKLKEEGVKKRRVFFTLEDQVALYGLETIWRDDTIVGYLRRGDYGFNLDCSIGTGYIEHPKGKIVTDEFLKSGNYQIEVLDKRYPATVFLKSPFDPKNQRLLGQYDQQFEEQSHFED
nr:PREDICTED: sarcosine dehydrogenase, mitochondrial [Tribolium castaneum]|eukprot:XP_968443.1 PREDICTED: sarcosine dehydrogenase, mitochondrial [Tribolium castaneum]